MSKVIAANVVKVKAKSYIRYLPPGSRPRGGYHQWDLPALVKAYAGTPNKAPGGGKVGIICLGGGYSNNDIQQLAVTYKFPVPKITDVSVDGVASNNYGNDPADGEAALDIACIAGAYGVMTGKPADIYMLFCQNTTDAFEACIKKADALGLDVVSCSWGIGESQFDSSAAASFNNTAKALTSKGLTIFVASGDNSADDNTGQLCVDMPSASPYVTSVGGTLKGDSTESAWGDGNPADQGGGGGYSNLFSFPAWQQNCPRPSGSNGRMVPDVSATADPNSGYLICLYGQLQGIGGTSGAAPFWAGIVAAAGTKFGNINPMFYKSSSPPITKDIVDGSNGWPAQKGPDPVTGAGVPNIDNLIAALVATKTPTSPPPVTVSPPPPPVTNPPITQPPPVVNGVTGSYLYTYTNGVLVSVSTPPAAPAAPKFSLFDYIPLIQTFIDNGVAIAKKYGKAAEGVLDAAKAFADNPNLTTYAAFEAAVSGLIYENPGSILPRFSVTDLGQWLQAALQILQLLQSVGVLSKPVS